MKPEVGQFWMDPDVHEVYRVMTVWPDGETVDLWNESRNRPSAARFHFQLFSKNWGSGPYTYLFTLKISS